VPLNWSAFFLQKRSAVVLAERISPFVSSEIKAGDINMVSLLSKGVTEIEAGLITMIAESQVYTS
jgi:hypothetical protein